LGPIEEQAQAQPQTHTTNTYQAKNQAKTSTNQEYACREELMAEASLGLPIEDQERGSIFHYFNS
jgi:hypothetical protein